QPFPELLGVEEVHVGVDAAGGEDAPLAGQHLGPRADHQVGVDAVLHVGVAGLADGGDPAAAHADVGPDHAPVVEHHDIGDDQVEGALGGGGGGLQHGLADGLAPAEDRLVAAGAAVLLDLDPQVGVAEADLVAGGRAVQRRVVGARDAGHRASSCFSTRPAPAGTRMPGTSRRPASATACTARESPGWKRSDVPAGMSSRNPCTRERSAGSPSGPAKEIAGCTSARWMCEPICTGRSPSLTTTPVRPSRPVLICTSPSPTRIAPGSSPGSATEPAPAAGRIGPLRVTSLRPSGKVASTCRWSTSSGTPGMTWSAVSTCTPSAISCSTVAPSRARSSAQQDSK